MFVSIAIEDVIAVIIDDVKVSLNVVKDEVVCVVESGVAVNLKKMKNRIKKLPKKSFVEILTKFEIRYKEEYYNKIFYR